MMNTIGGTIVSTSRAARVPVLVSVLAVSHVSERPSATRLTSRDLFSFLSSSVFTAFLASRPPAQDITH